MANKISGIDGRPVQVGGGAPVSRSRDATSEGRKSETTTSVSNIDVSDTARTLAALENRIATVPVGYADGLSRALSNRGRAIVNDQYARMVGHISMDLTLLDATDIPGVAVGDEVILIGKSEPCAITALEVAEQLGTVPYEVLCSIGKRVPRIYVDAA